MKPAVGIGCFAAGTLLMIAFYWNELLLTGLMLCAAMICLAIDDWKNLKLFVVATLVGGLCENITVMMGAWGYANTNYIFAPLWVPIGWGMAMVIFEEAFTKDAHAPRFSKRAILAAFSGAFLTGVFAPVEVFMALCFAIATAVFFALGFYRMDELRAGILAGVFGAGMEVTCILAGNWHYPFAITAVIPLWLPFAWFNAFLIMRRITKI